MKVFHNIAILQLASASPPLVGRVRIMTYWSGVVDAQLITSNRHAKPRAFADRRHGFILVTKAPNGSAIGIGYASSLLSVEHGGSALGVGSLAKP
jgi:hypothetical protein